MESFPPVRSDFLFFFFFDRSKAADDVVSKRGKFEQVMVASKEIAASSMQLVMASRVKADKESEKLANLNAAAKTISTLTGTVLATAESCRDKVTEAGKFSFFSCHSLNSESENGRKQRGPCRKNGKSGIESKKS